MVAFGDGAYTNYFSVDVQCQRLLELPPYQLLELRLIS